jgi:hypothetical protein
VQEGNKGVGSYVLVDAAIGIAVGVPFRDECTDCIPVNPIKANLFGLIGALIGLLLTPS